MNSLAAMKDVLGDDYEFHLLSPVDVLKKAVETNTVEDSLYQKGVIAVLAAGNLDIEINIQQDDEGAPQLEYFCCVRTNGEWESFAEIPYAVNLDVPDLEAEMYRVLAKFAQKRVLSFFAQNDHTNQNGRALEAEGEDEMER